MNPEFGKNPELSEVTAKQLAILYADVFAVSPWNEAWRCPLCNRFYGSEYSQNTLSSCCSTPLAIAYPEKETIDYIRKELSKPRAQLRLSYSPEGHLVAFAWGYEIENAKALAFQKWPQSEETQLQVVRAISEYTNTNFPLYYISEVGVTYSSRGNGIGLGLTKNLLDYGITFLQEAAVFRTNWASPMMRIATRLGMTQIMGPRIKVGSNQILKTEEIVGFIDEINQDRTLFITASKKTP